MAFHSIVFGIIHPLPEELFGLEVKQGCVKAPFVILSVSKGQENVSYEILRCALNDKNNVKRGCVCFDTPSHHSMHLISGFI